jgi:DNA-binding NtrC family response regulator
MYRERSLGGTNPVEKCWIKGGPVADVLIIDDDIDSAQMLAEVVRNEGHDVRIGHNGKDGLWLAEDRVPAVAVLDVQMPVLDGPAMACEMFLRDHGLEKVPVILVSGVSNLSELAARIGTPYFLRKPFHFPQLIELVRRALFERAAPRPAPESCDKER